MFTFSARALFFSIAAWVALAACSPGPTPLPAGSVKPLSEILVQGPEFTDVQADSVTVRIKTRVSPRTMSNMASGRSTPSRQDSSIEN